MSTCTKKMKYPNEKDALEDILRMKSKGSKFKGQRAYKCDKCNCWHVTSIPEGGEGALKTALSEIDRLKGEVSRIQKQKNSEIESKFIENLKKENRSLRDKYNEQRNKAKDLMYKNIHNKTADMTFLQKLIFLFSKNK